MQLIKKTIYWLGVAAIVGVPLVYVQWSLFPISFPKAVYLQTIMGIATLLAIWVWLKEPQTRPRKSLVVWSIIGLFVVNIISALVGVNLHQSMWADMARSTGLFFQAHLLLFVLIFGSGIVDREQWNRLIMISFGTAVVVSILGFIQFAIPNFLPNFSANRIASTLGNPVFLGGYIALHILLAPWLLTYVQTRWKKIGLVIAVLILLVAMILARPRGALLGLVVGMAVYLFYRGVTAGAPRWIRRTLIGAAILGVLVVSVGWVYRDAPIVANSSYADVLSTSTLKTRAINWSVALTGFTARPLLGWGPENYRTILDRHYDNRLTEVAYVETFVDKPHNMYVEVLATTGIVGGLAFVFVVIILWRLVLRLRKEGALSANQAGTVYAIAAGYGVQNFFLFDTAATYLTITTIVALVIFLAREIQPTPEPRRVSSTTAQMIGWGSVLILLVVMWRFSVSAMVSSLITNNGLQYSYINDWTSARAELNRAFDWYTPYDFERWRWGAGAVAAVVYEQTENQSEVGLPEHIRRMWREDIVQFAERGEQVYVRHPGSYLVKSFLGKYYYQLAVGSKESEYFLRAEELFNELIEFSSQKDEGGLLLVQAYLFSQQFDKALPLAQSLVERTPNSGLVRWYYAFVLLQDDATLQQGLAQIGEVMRLGYNFENSSQYELVAQRYVDADDLAGLAQFYEYVVTKPPETEEPSWFATWYARLGAVYAALGRIDDSRNATRKAIELDPTFRIEGEKFLQTLDQE